MAILIESKNDFLSGSSLSVSGSLAGSSLSINSGVASIDSSGLLSGSGSSLGAWSSWTPSFGGFSANPAIGIARYCQIGKLVKFYFELGNGTSNATTFTITLPVAASSADFQLAGVGRVKDNGTTQSGAGIILTRTGSATADVYLDFAGTGWTNSGTKTMVFASGSYEAA